MSLFCPPELKPVYYVQFSSKRSYKVFLYQVLMRGGEKSATATAEVNGLSSEQSVAVHRLVSSLPAFKNLLKTCDNPGQKFYYV